MKQIIIILIFYKLTFIGYCQPFRSMEFIDYHDVINSISKSSIIPELQNNLDFEAILLLDSTHINIVNKIRPDIVSEFRRFSTHKIPDKDKIFIPIKINSVKDCFKQDTLKKLLLSYADSSVLGKRIQYPVYIKNDKKAIYDIYSSTYSECFRITTKEDGLLIENIYITIP